MNDFDKIEIIFHKSLPLQVDVKLDITSDSPCMNASVNNACSHLIALLLNRRSKPCCTVCYTALMLIRYPQTIQNTFTNLCAVIAFIIKANPIFMIYHPTVPYTLSVRVSLVEVLIKNHIVTYYILVCLVRIFLIQCSIISSYIRICLPANTCFSLVVIVDVQPPLLFQ